MKSKTKQSSPLKTSPKIKQEQKQKQNGEYLTHCDPQNLNTTSTTSKKSKQNKNI